jgi:hypothetical protein
LYGALLFGLNEKGRREFSQLLGPAASTDLALAVSVLTSLAVTVTACSLLMPLEAFRIRALLGTPRGAPAVWAEVVADAGPESPAALLYRGLDVFLLREIPYVVVKFAVFGVAEDLLVQALVGQDDLLISALSGSIAGVAGALASNPADYVFTLANRDSITPGLAFETVLKEPGGIAKFWTGALPRCAFYSLFVASQFTIYDAVRSLSGLSMEDTKLVLDAVGTYYTGAEAPIQNVLRW